MCSIGFLTCLLVVTGTAYGFPYRAFLRPDLRIVNGTAAERGQFPFMVALRYKNSFTCGASIVNERWVLTAGHCVYGRNSPHFSILVGTNDLTQHGAIVEAEEVILHEDYDPYEIVNDVAVIKLKRPLVFSDLIQPVELPSSDQETPGGLVATVIGWGLPHSGGSAVSLLQYVDILTYSDEECYRLHDEDLKPKPSNICAGVPEGGKGQCSGDSGGPLVVNGYQAGIVSWSVKPCGVAGYPGVYTEVSYFTDWVKSKTG